MNLKRRLTASSAAVAISGGLLAFEATPATAAPNGTAFAASSATPVDAQGPWRVADSLSPNTIASWSYTSGPTDAAYNCFLVGTAWELRRQC